MTSHWLYTTILLLHSLSVDSFGRGAPDSACEEDMKPRHGFATQAGRPPAEIVVDQSTVRQDQYLRVTLRSTKPFKGFLLRAEDINSRKNEYGSWSAVGTWYIPYQNATSSPSSGQYLHCGGRAQSAVTHAGHQQTLFVVSFQWRPPVGLEGRVRIQATMVEDYRTYWTGVLAPAVTVLPVLEDTVTGRVQYVDSDDLFGLAGTPSPSSTRKETTVRTVKASRPTEKVTRRAIVTSTTFTTITSTLTTTTSTSTTTTTTFTSTTTITTTTSTSTTTTTTTSTTYATATKTATTTSKAMSTSYVRIAAQTDSPAILETDTTSTKSGRFDSYGVGADMSQEESTMEEVTDFPLDFEPSNSSSLTGGEEGDHLLEEEADLGEEGDHPPRSGRRNDEEEENYQGLEAEYGSWKSGGQSVWSLRCHCLLWTVAIIMLLYWFPNS